LAVYGWRWLALTALVVVLDQASKAWVMHAIRPGEVRPVTDFLSLVLAFNAGAAFSFLGDASGWQRWLFTAAALVASGVIVWLLRRGGDALYCAALALILGGALGNLWDRAVIGRVVDFILVHHYLPAALPGAAWLDPFPAFNVADSAISVGAVLLIIDSFRQRRRPEQARPA
jgi:signal peptidase II